MRDQKLEIAAHHTIAPGITPHAPGHDQPTTSFISTAAVKNLQKL